MGFIGWSGGVGVEEEEEEEETCIEYEGVIG